MIFHKTPIAGLYTADPEPFRDERGLFARTFCRREFEEIGHEK
jgi:dTDP-4-dehydrorhamnose 3,5-epimerase